MTLLLLINIGLIGLFAHWFKRWARGQTESDFITYMGVHKRHSLASVATMIGAVAALYSVSEVVLSQQAMALAFLAGYSIDSTVNKSPEDD